MKTNIRFWSYLTQFLLEWEVLQTKVVEKIKTNIFSQQIFSKNFAIYETMQKNTIESDSPPITIWCLNIACWIPKVTNTHSVYVILTAFPLQEWLHLCTSVLTVYVRCLSCYARSEPTLGLCQDTVMFWFHNLKMKEVCGLVFIINFAIRQTYTFHKSQCWIL